MPLVVPFCSLALENEMKLKTLNFRVLRDFGVGGWGGGGGLGSEGGRGGRGRGSDGERVWYVYRVF